MLSWLSVRYAPAGRLHHWYSSRSLPISLVHREFYLPLTPSSRAVSVTPSQVSWEISPPTHTTAYPPFTPSNSGQRSPPTYYRGCWHVVSRDFFLCYRPVSSQRKAVYAPKGVIPHAASLHQACAHCGRFLTAAPRRDLGRSQSQCDWSSSQTSDRSMPW